MVAGRMQQRVTHQVADRVERRRLPQFGRADGRQPLVEQRQREHARARRRAVDDRRVERLGREIDDVLPRGRDLHVEIGMLVLEAHDARQHPAHHAGRHFQREIGALPRELHRDVLDPRKALVDDRQQLLAFRRQREALRMPLEQRKTVMRLERLDLPAHRPLRDAQLLGRAGEAAVAGHRREDLQCVQGRKSVHEEGKRKNGAKGRAPAPARAVRHDKPNAGFARGARR